MFFSNPAFDMQMTITLIIISVVITLIFFARSKSLPKALVIFSVLANLSFLINIWSRMFVYYHILFVLYFSIIIWPVINIVLLIKFFKNKK